MTISVEAIGIPLQQRRSSEAEYRQAVRSQLISRQVGMRIA